MLLRVPRKVSLFLSLVQKEPHGYSGAPLDVSQKGKTSPWFADQVNRAVVVGGQSPS